jgi:hypothetical protein
MPADRRELGKQPFRHFVGDEPVQHDQRERLSRAELRGQLIDPARP